MIHHLAVWTTDLEKMRDFYVKYFEGKSNALYHNPNTGFRSYFVSFGEGAKLELMQLPTVNEAGNSNSENLDRQTLGLAHVAFSLGSRERVDQLTERLTRDGFTLVSGPRTTGDGYYESCVLDPEMNRVEITV